MKRKLTDGEERRLCDAYRDGLPASTIKERFGVTTRVMTEVLERRGVELRPKGTKARPLT